jgi:predicted nucleic acid-binding protein
VTRFVITPDVAIRLAEQRPALAVDVRLVAPTLLRSQVLSSMYQRVRRGELERAAADAQLDHIRGLGMRLLGDRVLQSVAWKVAARLDLPDTFAAEYVALTTLQADALVTGDDELAVAAAALVAIGSYDDLVAAS